MRLDVFTLFPDAFAWFSQQVHVARARELGVELNLWDLPATPRPLRHGQVDDTPYGGGAGMVLRIDWSCAALEAVFAVDPARVGDMRRVVELTPRGRQLDDPAGHRARRRRPLRALRPLRGHRRARLAPGEDRVSIGPYVLSGGEIAAQVLLDAVVGASQTGAVSNPASVAG